MVEGNNLPFPEEPDGEKSSNGLEPSREFRSKREIKPVVKLSYDELGKSTNRPIYTSIYSMPVHCRSVRVREVSVTLFGATLLLLAVNAM